MWPVKGGSQEGGVRGQGLGREEGSAETEVGPHVASGGWRGGSAGRAGGGCVPMKGHSPVTRAARKGPAAPHPKSQGRGWITDPVA